MATSLICQKDQFKWKTVSVRNCLQLFCWYLRKGKGKKTQYSAEFCFSVILNTEIFRGLIKHYREMKQYYYLHFKELKSIPCKLLQGISLNKHNLKKKKKYSFSLHLTIMNFVLLKKESMSPNWREAKQGKLSNIT